MGQFGTVAWWQRLLFGFGALVFSRLPRILPARVATCSFLLAAFPFLGCGSGIELRQHPAVLPASPYPSDPGRYTTYHSYGDSITAGYWLPDPAKEAYPFLVGFDRGLTVSNYAFSGDQACDVAPRQIFGNADSPSLVSPPLYSLLIGTNDVDIKGTGPYEGVFNLCQLASVSWLAMPSNFKVLANGDAVVTKGGGSLDTSHHWNAWTTAALGASISFTITTQQAGPIYAWLIIDDENPGSYSYSMDGTIIGTGHTRTTPAISTFNGTTDSLGFLRLPTVLAGKHVVTFTQTNSEPNGFSIVAIGAPPMTKLDTLPTVLVGTIPYQLLFAGSARCTQSDSPCLQYIHDIESNINLLASDGLDVRLFDTRQYMLGNPNEMTDSVHPNSLGQIELSHAVEATF